MIAKLCTRGATRAEAVSKMSDALDNLHITGISHNVPFLQAIYSHQRFQDGRLSTGFIAEEFPDGFHGTDLPEARIEAAAAVAAFARLRTRTREIGINGQMPGFTHQEERDWVVVLGDKSWPVHARPIEGGAEIEIGGHVRTLKSEWKPGQSLCKVEIDGEDFGFLVEARPLGYRIGHGGAALDMKVLRPREAELARLMPVKLPPDTSKFLLCPMPGLVVAIHVAEGEPVKAGQPLAVVEAMKMENVLRAERDGTVAKVAAKKGDSLAVDQVILEFE
jgi:propionyl-CoA carboxylase alpha chain